MMDEKDTLSSDVAQASPVSTTHDELIDTIGHWDWIEPGPLVKALRAVVELHKPRESTRTHGVPNSEGVSIGAAEPSCDAAGCREEYPCPTIQAIEKELA